MILINFSHPMTDEQLERITQLLGQPIDTILSFPAQFDQHRPFIPQAAELVDRVGLTPQHWQTDAILVNLPSLNSIASVVLAELHGRMGYFPPIVRLRPIEEALPPRYEVAEIINLQGVRDTARKKRINNA